MRITDYELSHLILRFEQEKDMKPMHCVQNLGALRDLVSLRIEHAGCRKALDAAIRLALTFQRKVPPMQLSEDSYDEYQNAGLELKRLQAACGEASYDV